MFRSTLLIPGTFMPYFNYDIENTLDELNCVAQDHQNNFDNLKLQQIDWINMLYRHNSTFSSDADTRYKDNTR